MVWPIASPAPRRSSRPRKAARIRGNRDRFGGRHDVAIEVAHHAHRAYLVEHALEFFRQRQALHEEALDVHAIGQQRRTYRFLQFRDIASSLAAMSIR